MITASSDVKGAIRQGCRAWRTETLLLHGVRCKNCISKIDEALRLAPGIKKARVERDLRTLRLIHNLDDPLTSVTKLIAPLGAYHVERRRLLRSMASSLAAYRPLLIVTGLVLLFAFGLQMVRGWPNERLMADLMAGYFLIFGALKVVNAKSFAAAYARYDALAKRSARYARAYPYLEMTLGAAYLIWPDLSLLHVAVLFLMLEKAWSVDQALRQGTVSQCACLGGFFSIPISKVTVAEDLLMAAMAAAMFLQN